MSLAFLIAFAVPFTARAGETTVDLSIGPLVGTHAEPGVTETVAPVPIPILSISHRESAFEAFVEGFPISPPITSSSAVQSISTHLTFENAVLRGYVLHDRLAFGAGETIYNQSSIYEPSGGVAASRVVGGRYEIAGLPLRNRGFRIALDLVPVLLGTVRQTSRFGFSFPNEFERGSQSEVNASYEHELTHTQFAYGIRYINYVAHFSGTTELADRNTGVRPYVSYGLRF